MASAQHCPFVARHHHKEMWHSPPSHFLFWDDAPAREVVLAKGPSGTGTRALASLATCPSPGKLDNCSMIRSRMFNLA